MDYFYLKALHLIFMVCWFAGLFYLVRLFIYHKEAAKKQKQEQAILQAQFTIMTGRLLNIITWPSAVLTTVFGISMLYYNPELLKQDWMQVKLVFATLLWGYTYSCQHYYNQMKIGQITSKESKLRIWNEVATLFLFAIIFMAVLKNSMSWIFATFSLVALAVVLMILIKLYKKYMRS